MGAAFESLTSKMQIFVMEYIGDMNRVRAAKEAGYKGSDKVLGIMAAKLLAKPKVQAAIAEVGQPLLDNAYLTAENILTQLSRFLFSNMIDYLTADGYLKCSLSELPENIKQCIESFEVEKDFDREGDLRGERIKVKLVSKIKALELAMKYQNLIGPSNVTNIQNNIGFDWNKFYENPPNVVEERMDKALNIAKEK